MHLYPVTVGHIESEWRRYLLAIGIFFAAFGLRIIVLPVEADLAFLFFLPGVAIVALLCGLVPSALYILLAASAGAYVFLPPYWAFEVDKLTPTIAFVVSATTILLIINFYQRRVAHQTQTLTDEMSAKQRLMDQLQQSMARLIALESDFRQTFEQAAVGIAHVKADGHWLRVNQKLCSIVGYSQEELLQLTFQDITHPDDLDVDLAYAHKMLSGDLKTYSTEKRYIRKDGHPIWINLTVALVRNVAGEPDHFISVIEDIQPRKLAEQDLRESEAQYHGVIETSSDGFWLVDPEGKLLEVNDSYVRQSGYSREELLAMHIGDLDAEESLEETASRMERMRRDGHDQFESQHRAKDGSLWPVEIATSFLPIAGGKYFGFVRDISDRKQTELDRHELRAELGQLLQLHVARQTAIALAHDLNQPLVGISVYSEAALRMLEAGNPKPEKLIYALQSSATASQRAGAVVRQLISLLHKTETTGETLDINKLVKDSLLVAQADGLDISHVTLGVAQALPPVYANKLHIQKVISNLLRNSEEAMRDMRKETSITICASLIEGAAQVTIQDNGPGLSEEISERIFDPFFTTKPTGIGMGLAISRTLIEANGGRLWHEPSAKGATFHFTVPLAQHDE